MPRGQEHPAGAPGGFAELEGRENKDKIESWSCEGELGLQGAPASHKASWDLQIREFQLVGESWVSLLIGNLCAIPSNLAWWVMSPLIKSFPTHPIP